MTSSAAVGWWKERAAICNSVIDRESVTYVNRYRLADSKLLLKAISRSPDGSPLCTKRGRIESHLGLVQLKRYRTFSPPCYLHKDNCFKQRRTRVDCRLFDNSVAIFIVAATSVNVVLCSKYIRR